MSYNNTSILPWVSKILPNLSKMEAEALNFIAQCGPEGATSEQFALSQGKYPNAVSGRFTSLKAQNLIIAHGQRKTRAGNAADVYVLSTLLEFKQEPTGQISFA